MRSIATVKVISNSSYWLHLILRLTLLLHHAIEGQFQSIKDFRMAWLGFQSSVRDPTFLTLHYCLHPALSDYQRLDVSYPLIGHSHSWHYLPIITCLKFLKLRSKYFKPELFCEKWPTYTLALFFRTTNLVAPRYTGCCHKSSHAKPSCTKIKKQPFKATTGVC